MEKDLDLIKLKIEELLKAYDSSIALNKNLESKVMSLELEKKKMQDEISLLNTSTNAIKLTTFAYTLPENERMELKKTIIEYIKEIDYCIKTLNQ
jgi:hypothetical protein